MSSQLARLLLRGKLMNKTAKNLSPEQIKEVEDCCQLVWNDPDLAKVKTAFCSKLTWTIGNDYMDVGAALQEVWVVYWKTTVDILYHRPKRDMQKMIEATCAKCGHIKVINCQACDSTGIVSNMKCDVCHGAGYTKTDPSMLCRCGATATLSIQEDLFEMSMNDAKDFYQKTTGKPAPETDRSILENPIQRRKFYKTTLWTYLRQICNENKPKTYKASTIVKEYAEKAAAVVVKDIIEDSGKMDYKQKTEDGQTTYTTNTNVFSLDNVMRLRELQDMMVSENVEIDLKDNQIVVRKAGDTHIIAVNVKKESRVNYISLTPVDDEEKSSTYLYPNTLVNSIAPPCKISEIEEADGLAYVRKKLSTTARQIFEIIINPPDEYADKFSTNPVRRSNISKFLNLTKSEVDAAWEKIQQATIEAGLR